MISKKITLGTAQFDNNYAKIFRANENKAQNYQNLKKLFNYAYKKKIVYIDTALSYTNSSSYLSNFISNKKYRIIIKIPKIPRKTRNYQDWLEKKILQSLKTIGIKKFWAILFHSSDFLKLNKKNDIINALQRLKRKKYCNKIGISVYKKKEIESHLKNWKPDIIEFPYNILDRRLSDKYLIKIKKKKVLLFARSIFLKGLLLSKNQPNYFKKWRRKLATWLQYCDKNNLSVLEGSIIYVLQKPFIDKIILGLENKKQLDQILNINFKRSNIKFPNFNIKDQKILNPTFWRI